jgi:hypothetical protein
LEQLKLRLDLERIAWMLGIQKPLDLLNYQRNLAWVAGGDGNQSQVACAKKPLLQCG